MTLLHKEAGLQSPVVGSFQLDQTLRGIRRKKGDLVHQKAPITPELLLTIRGQLDLSSPRHRAVWAAALMMFVGLLRRSNVMPPSASGFSSEKHLCRSDISFDNLGCRLRIRWSKTMQFKQQATVFLPRRKGHLLCPVRAVFMALDSSPGGWDGPAIGFYAQGIFTPLTPPVFIEELRKALSGSGCDPMDYAGHSFRRGGATWLHNCGASSEMIKLMGHWSSDCYREYISNADKDREQTAAMMVNSLP